MITGTIGNFVQMQKLTNKWEQKKNSGDVLSKNERNERENWTKEQRMINDFHEQMEREKESDKRNAIANKIASGQKLTPEEEQYLGSYDPKGLSDYRQTRSERKAYEEKIKNCKTKDEVQKLKTTTLGNEFSSLNKFVNDPYISVSEKLKKAQQVLGKTRNFQMAEEEFILSGKYDKLPTEAEILIENVEESQMEDAEYIPEESVVSDESVVPEDLSEGVTTKDPAKEIEKINNRLSMIVQIEKEQLQTSIDKVLESEKEKPVGKNVNISA